MTSNDNTDDEMVMPRRSFGIGALAFGSGTFTLGYDTEREVTPVWDQADFELARARIHDQTILNGFELYVYVEFEEWVSDVPVTVIAKSDKGKRIKKTEFRASGTAESTIIGMWRFPSTVIIRRG